MENITAVTEFIAKEAVKEGKLVLTNFKEKTTDRGDTVIFDYEDLENMSKDFINETEIAVE